VGPERELSPASSVRSCPRRSRPAPAGDEALRLVRRSAPPSALPSRERDEPAAASSSEPDAPDLEHGLEQSRRLVARLRAENFALRQELERLTIFRHLALRDELTGLHNRRSFEECLRREWSRAHRCLQPLAVLAIDLDQFKPINDSFGHAVGDGVLRWFAKQLSSACREIDVVGRLGGDEFVILLPSTDAAAAELIGQRLERSVEQAADAPRLPGGGAVRFSWGAAALADDARSPTELLIRADEAMYRHKRRRAAASLGKVAAA
jgi:diguanylate cyclase (GGDEF)-like protein